MKRRVKPTSCYRMEPGNDLSVINKGAIFLVRETGRGNRVAVLSRDKTDVSRGGGNK